MNFSQVDPVALASLTFAIAGVVELYNRLVAKDWKTAGTIAVAGIAGAVLSHFVGGSVSWFTGLLIGFSASGLISTVQHFGSPSAPTN